MDLTDQDKVWLRHPPLFMRTLVLGGHWIVLMGIGWGLITQKHLFRCCPPVGWAALAAFGTAGMLWYAAPVLILWRQMRDDVKQGVAEMVCGALQKKPQPNILTGAAPLELLDEWQRPFCLRIRDYQAVHFEVGYQYKLRYAPRSRWVLSAELVSRPRFWPRQAFGFSLDEVFANRKKRLSASQAREWRVYRRWFYLLAVLLILFVDLPTVAFTTLTIVYGLPAQGDAILGIVLGVFFWIASLWSMLLLAHLYRAFQDRLRAAPVEILYEVKKAEIVPDPTQLLTYRLVRDEVTLLLNAIQYDSLDDDVIYRFYYLAGVYPAIVALEPEPINEG